MQRDAIDAVRAGRPEVHVVTNLGHPMTAYQWSMDHLGAEWVRCRNFDGTEAGYWRADSLRALERTYAECEHKWRDYSAYGGDFVKTPIVCRDCGAPYAG